MREQIRRRAGAAVVDGFFRTASALGRLHPRAKPSAHGVEVRRDVSYGPLAAHRLDVWKRHDLVAPAPAVLYVHGGGFRILSKETHWIMALAYARRGYVVFNIDYRLAPTDPFPAAVEDVCAAYTWLAAHAREYGADPSRLVLAGESAGANLVTAATLTTCWRRDEPAARAVFDTGLVPKAVVAACGMHQVTDPGRFSRRKRKLPRVVADRIDEVTHAYVGHAAVAGDPRLDLADPLVFLERKSAPTRALPAFFIPCGTGDPLLDDTRRLGAALRALGATAEDRYYGGELHAFHALVFRRNARLCWADTFRFLDEHLR